MPERAQDDRDRSPSLRIFICIEVPASIKDRIDKLQQDLRRIKASIGWTRSSNIHLTLRFLGDVPSLRLPDVCAAAERAARGIDPFEIEVSGSGCFPSLRVPRVLWIGLNGVADSLKQLHANIEDELAGRGFDRKGRRFSPHLTIARVRDPRNAGEVAEKLIATGFESERFQANEVIVMRSQLSPKGSIYTPQAVIRLGS